MNRPKLLILQVGQIIWATAEEIQGDGQMIVAYQGELLRVKNLASPRFQVGQRIRLQVTSTLPLEFRYMPVQSAARFGLDVQA